MAAYVDGVREQPLILDAFFIHGAEEKLPKANAGFFRRAWVSISRFFRTFFYRPDRAESDELVVWVNRSRPYVDLIQKFADDVFTRESGIKVKVTSLITTASSSSPTRRTAVPMWPWGYQHGFPTSTGCGGCLLT